MLNIPSVVQAYDASTRTFEDPPEDVRRVVIKKGKVSAENQLVTNLSAIAIKPVGGGVLIALCMAPPR